MKFDTFLREGRFVKIVLASRRELNFRRSQGVDSEPNCVRSVIKIHLKNKHQKYPPKYTILGSLLGAILASFWSLGCLMATLGRQMGIWAPFLIPGCLLWAPFGSPLGGFWASLGSFGCSFGGLWVSFGHLLAPFWTPRDNLRDLQWGFGVPLLTLIFFWKPRLPLLLFAFPLASNSILDPRMLLGSCGAQLHARLSSFQCVLIYIICPVCRVV